MKSGRSRSKKRTGLINLLIIFFVVIAGVTYFKDEVISFLGVNEDIPALSESNDGNRNNDGGKNQDNQDNNNEVNTENNKGDQLVDNWPLILANIDHPIPEDYRIETRTLPNGLAFDARAYDNLMTMLNDGEKQGLSFVVCSAYRTVDFQKNLFEAQVAKQQKNNGLSYNEAYEVAKTIVALPGTSEHNLGLAADIVALDYQMLDEGYAATPEAKWLKENSAKYGFVLRYPAEKEEITKIIYEPWHFRYVGTEHAQEINRLNLCLEEYLDYLKNGVI